MMRACFCRVKDKLKEKKYGLLIMFSIVLLFLVLAYAGIRLYRSTVNYRYKESISLAEKSYEDGRYEDSAYYFVNAQDLITGVKMNQIKKALHRRTKESEKKAAQILLESSDEYLLKGEYLQAFEVLKEGEAYMEDADLKKRIEYLQDHIILLNAKVYVDGALKEEREYNEAGKQIKEIEYNEAGNVSYLYEFEYNKQQKQIGGVVYFNGDIVYRIEDKYNTAGRETERLIYMEEGSLVVQIKFEYDLVGNKKKETIYSGEGIPIISNEFDNKGNTIKETDYDEMGDIAYQIENEYDEEGSQIVAILYDDAGNEIDLLQSIYKYRYDVEGNVMERTGYNISSRKTDWRQYNENGQPIRGVKYNFMEEVSREWEKIYNALGYMTYDNEDMDITFVYEYQMGNPA